MDQQPDILSEISNAFAATLAAEAAPRTPKLVTCQIERGLLPEDIREYLDADGNLTTTVKAAQKDIRTLRERHHSVARLAAEGVPSVIIAQICNYTESYLSVLLQAPAMVELVSFYRSSRNAAAQHIGENLRVLAGMSAERLVERVEKDELSTQELLAAAKLGYDRSGHGPQSSIHNVTEHHIIAPELIREKHLEALRRDKELIIHPESVREAIPALPAPDSDETP